VRGRDAMQMNGGDEPDFSEVITEENKTTKH
jgi:hypothetical protein